MNAPAFGLDADKVPLERTVRSIERKRIRAYSLLVLADIAAIFVGFIIGGWLYRDALPDPQAVLEAQLIFPLFVTIAIYQRVYSIRSLTEARYAIARLTLALLVAAALLNFIAFYAKFNEAFSRATFTIGLTFTLALMAAIRIASTRLLRRRWGAVARNVLIVDDGGPSFHLDHASRLDTATLSIAPAHTDPAMVDRLGRLLVNQEQVIVSCTRDRREAWAATLRSAGVDGQIISDDVADAGILGIARYDAAGSSGQSRVGLVVSAGPLGLRGRVFKRTFDLLVASIAIVVSAPALILIALAVKLQDGGPILFVQKRHGRGNRYFRMLKFRTMRADRSDHGGTQSTARDDARVTAVGGFLRQTSLDELPQLFNVLRGDMAIVGPRPHAARSQAGDKHFWEVDERYWHRHSLKPGMTGLAQIRGQRGATDHEDDLSIRLQSDLEYISNWSLWGDFVIVVRTLGVLTHENAY